MSTQPKITAVAPWFGSNRMLAHTVGEELRGCKWVGVPFAGGMSELLHIQASTIVVNDIHLDIINLAQVIAIPAAREWLQREASAMPFHPDVLSTAQNRCKESPPPNEHPDCVRALWYFVACWMNRSAKAGTDGEFSGSLPIRWNANGGDSNTRYRSAVESLEHWGQIMRRCNFSTLEVSDFLSKVKDEPNHGLYLDPPFPGPGDNYKHKFTEEQHKQLAERLRQFQHTRIVCRFYDHPLIREIYPQDVWHWRFSKGRKQSNETSPEVLIINGASYGEQS